MSEKNIFRERAKKLWIFVVISGILHLYIGFVFITTDIMRYHFLSNLFIWAFMANAIGETVFRLAVFRKPDTQRVFASAFDIVAGLLIYVFPIISVIVLPAYLAISFLIRGLTDMVVARHTDSFSLTSQRFLKNIGMLKVSMALLILAVAVIAPANVAVAGSAILLAGVVNIFLGIQFRTYKSTAVITHS